MEMVRNVMWRKCLYKDTMHWIIRLVWTLAIGWWLSMLWVAAGLLLICTIVFAPIGGAMLAKTGIVLTLPADPPTVRVETQSSD